MIKKHALLGKYDEYFTSLNQLLDHTDEITYYLSTEVSYAYDSEKIKDFIRIQIEIGDGTEVYSRRSKIFFKDELIPIRNLTTRMVFHK